MITIVTAILILAGVEAGARMAESRLADSSVDAAGWPTLVAATQARQIIDHEPVDLLFAGSSIMLHAVDPSRFTELTGITSYNAGMNSFPIRLTETWLLDFVEPRLSPHTVVLGISSFELNDVGMRQATNYEAFATSPGWEAITGGRSGFLYVLDGVLDERSVLWRYRSTMRDPVELWRTLAHGATFVPSDRLAPDGAWVHDPALEGYRIDADTFETVRTGSFDPWSVGGPGIDSLRRIGTTLADRGVRLIILSTPVYGPDYVELHPQGEADLESYRAAVQAVATEVEAEYIDAEHLYRTTEVFRDLMHLSPSGRERFTLYLADLLG